MRMLYLVAVLLTPLCLTGCIIIPIADLLQGPPLQEQMLEDGGGLLSKEKIAIIDVTGVISGRESMSLVASQANSVAEIKTRLDWAASDPEVHAVVLRIASPGGEVTACDNIFRQVKKFREESGKPVVACILDQGASGGYYIAAAADSIIANPTAIVGSIGVILQSYDLSQLIAKIGVKVEPVKSADKKDIGSLFRPMSGDERQLLQKLVDDMYQRFVDVVESSRAGLDRKAVLAVADGRVVSGTEAAKLKLVDRTGYLDDAIDEAARRASVESPTVVRYTRRATGGANIYSQVGVPSPQAEMSLKLPADWMAGARLYYLWRPGW